jgi:hypothetical protein
LPDRVPPVKLLAAPQLYREQQAAEEAQNRTEATTRQKNPRCSEGVNKNNEK